MPGYQAAQLQLTLGGIPGVSASQVQTLVGDLNLLSSGASAPNLGPDLDAVLASIGHTPGASGVVTPLITTIDGLLGSSPTTSGIAQTIDQLDTVASTAGVPAPVGGALAQIASGLTGADLAALLGQAGTPLSMSAVQQVVGELGALGSIPTGSPVPAGGLSAVGQALDTIAGQAGIPPAAATALQGVADLFGSQSPISATTLGTAVGTLESTLPALYGTPVVGPAAGSAVGSMATEIAASPPASGSGSTADAGSVQYLLSASTGATIHAFRYHNGRAVVTVACPAGTAGGCHSTVYVKVKNGRSLSRAMTIKAGKSKTAKIVLPHSAVAAHAHARTLSMTATVVTGSYATSKTIHHRIK